MSSSTTLDTAREWYATGAQRVQSETVNLGLSYLDRAIAVFEEAGERRLLTYARHHKLLGLMLETRHEELENLFPEVMEGYTALDDAYGKSLLLAHLAVSLAGQEQWDAAAAHLNLAGVIAENDAQSAVLAYVYEQQARIFRHRDNLNLAVQRYTQAETLAGGRDDAYAAGLYRQARAETLTALGERAEATALLEDAQDTLVRSGHFREGVDCLNTLHRLYERAGMADDANRVKELIHYCGQRMIQDENQRRAGRYTGPPVEPAAA